MADLFTAEHLKILDVLDNIKQAREHLKVFYAGTRLVSPMEYAEKAHQNRAYFRPDQDSIQYVLEVFHPLTNEAGRTPYYLECRVIFDLPYEYFGMKMGQEIPRDAQKKLGEPCKQAGLLLLNPMMMSAITKLNDRKYPGQGKMGWTREARSFWKKLFG